MFFAFRIIAGWLQVDRGLSAGIPRRVAVRVLSFELSADTASVDLEAPGLNEECKGGLVPWWMESQ